MIDLVLLAYLVNIGLSLRSMTSLGSCITAAFRAFDTMCRVIGNRRRHHVKMRRGGLGRKGGNENTGDIYIGNQFQRRLRLVTGLNERKFWALTRVVRFPRSGESHSGVIDPVKGLSVLLEPQKRSPIMRSLSDLSFRSFPRQNRKNIFSHLQKTIFRLRAASRGAWHTLSIQTCRAWRTLPWSAINVRIPCMSIHIRFSFFQLRDKCLLRMV